MINTRPVFAYGCFGLGIRSDFECPELAPSQRAPEITVRRGLVPERLPDPAGEGVLFQASPGIFLLNIPEIARYAVCDGREIVVEPAAGAAEDAVRLFLLGTALGALLLQRGILALHASAIATRRGAVVFMGHSGAGKSTLAGVFGRRGYSVLADEVCGVDTADFPVVLPANSGVMLWEEAVERLGMSSTDLRPARAGLRKYVVPPFRRFDGDAPHLHAIYALDCVPDGRPAIEALRGAAKVRALTHHTFRESFVRPLGLTSLHFAQVGAVARQIRMARASRPQAWSTDELADLLTADFDS